MTAWDVRRWSGITALLNRLGYDEASGELGDFTTTRRVIPMSLIAIGIGVVATFVAWALLRLIYLFNNLFFFQRWSAQPISPAANRLGVLEIFIPIAGALIVGFMARFGSEKIRGHGIPEAIEAILIGGSRIEPKVAVLKPVSSAISIGSGGPFGAEGPIIMTGGAFGSLIAQFFHLTSAERKTLLVAGAAAGMSATFAAPVASVLLAVELLLFEWKPRSLIPVACASVAAAAARPYILGMGPLFPVPHHAAFIGPASLFGCVLVGILAGLLSALLTEAVYAAEDAFHKLPIHWMWWPAIGGLVVGIGGLIFPPALGVGYDNIGHLLAGNVTASAILGILIVKSVIWSISLGSGTSGGVLAPLLMVGGALGGVEAMFLPHQGAGFWALISMGATLAGTMRAPLTGVIFSLELTHDVNSLLPLLLASALSYGVTVLLMRRSILTEKVARRGYHLSQEYATDPMETLFVREVMRPNILALHGDTPVGDLAERIQNDHGDRDLQRVYPVLDSQHRLVGVISRSQLRDWLAEQNQSGRSRPLAELATPEPVFAYADETLRSLVYRMAQTSRTHLPVVDREAGNQVVGMVSLNDLLKARALNLEAERRRERILRLHRFFPSRPEGTNGHDANGDSEVHASAPPDPMDEAPTP
ncbi:MAG TPA: chloride channel protein [Chthonomonadaceae bacterium]|nr:chloride channel protein [Chthonomonadaceae bacterium]